MQFVVVLALVVHDGQLLHKVLSNRFLDECHQLIAEIRVLPLKHKLHALGGCFAQQTTEMGWCGFFPYPKCVGKEVGTETQERELLFS